MKAKHEWRKQEKNIYLPKSKPELIDVPSFNFIVIEGQGNPNRPEFAEHVGALYSLAYVIKMGLKKSDLKPEGYVDYTVYPLEGVWDITDEAKGNFDGTINKEDLTYKLMIRQPAFVSEHYVAEVFELLMNKKSNPLLARVEFQTLPEGKCVQMLHLGPFENEPDSFAKMELFAEENGLKRKSKIHREIYLSDARRVSPEKYKTVLRFQVDA